MLFVQRDLVCFSCLLLSSSRAWQSLSPHSGHGANRLPQAWGRRHIALGTSAQRGYQVLPPGIPSPLLLLCSSKQGKEVLSCRDGGDFSRDSSLGVETEEGPGSMPP